MNILLVFFIFSIVPVIGVYRVARRNGRRAGTWALLTAVAIVVVYGAATISMGFLAAFRAPDLSSDRARETAMTLLLFSNGAALLVSILINAAALYLASRPLQKDELRGKIPPPPDFGDNS